MSAENMHELINQAARINAILNLVRNPDARAELELSVVDRDFKEALAKLETSWAIAIQAVKKIQSQDSAH